MDIMQKIVTFYSTLEPNYTNKKTDPIEIKKIYIVHYFVYKSLYLVTKWGWVDYWAP